MSAYLGPIIICNKTDQNAFHIQVELFKESLCLAPSDDFADFMDANKVHIWISNRKVSEKRNWFLDSTELKTMSFVLIDQTDIDEELEAFQNYFSKETKILKDQYGQENVQVRWGLITHYS